MRRWFQAFRAAAIVGSIWALAWFGAGMFLLLIVGPDAADVPFPLAFGFLGFLSGMIFSAILGLTERRRSFGELSLARFASWGALGGAMLALAFTVLAGASLPVTMLVFILAGGGSAGSTLLLARRAGTTGRVEGDIEDGIK